MPCIAACEASEGQTAINMPPSAAMEVTLPYLHEAGIPGQGNISWFLSWLDLWLRLLPSWGLGEWEATHAHQSFNESFHDTNECQRHPSGPKGSKSCDSTFQGYQCEPEISHNFGQYSPFYSVPSDISADIPHGCSVTFAQLLSRHGARDPTVRSNPLHNRVAWILIAQTTGVKNQIVQGRCGTAAGQCPSFHRLIRLPRRLRVHSGRRRAHAVRPAANGQLGRQVLPTLRGSGVKTHSFPSLRGPGSCGRVCAQLDARLPRSEAVRQARQA